MVCFIFITKHNFFRQMYFNQPNMEDDNESIDLTPKIQELPVIQIFGFDGSFIKFQRVFLEKLFENFV